MADSDTKYLGVSQPISTAHPEELDLRLTEALKDCLESKNLFEDESELQKRIDVLCSVTAIVKEFIRVVTRQKLIGIDGEEPDCGGKLFTCGSYRLGVHNRGADIDTLLVAPRHVDRAHFFSIFFDMLAADPNVTELHRVEDAFVPVIKLQYNGIDLDILFARLALKAIPDDQSLQDDNLLKNLDDKSIRSLNGSRVAHEILNCIPNQETFVVVLRAVKHWATVHGIYSNVLGYFGGISWAILVARICQLYPNAAPAKLLQKFFYVFKQWQWPSPVFLKDSDANRPEISSSLTEMVWDPRIRTGDRLHLMPIITPAYPEQNSTYNVSNSTKKIICGELEEAAVIADEVFMGKSSWDKLFEPINFFTRYKHFVCVLCVAKDNVDHINYCGFIESRLRQLTANLERHEAVVCAQVGTKQYEPLNLDRFNSIGYENPISNLWFVGLELDVNLARALDLTVEITNFVNLVSTQQSAARQKYNEHMKIEVKYVPQKDIKYYLQKEDFLYGRRYAKRKPPLSRTASDTGNLSTTCSANAKQSTKPPADDSTLSVNSSMDGDSTLTSEKMDTSEVADEINTENGAKQEPLSKPVFSFGAENNIFPEIIEPKAVDSDAPVKAVLQESFNSLPTVELSPDEDLKTRTQVQLKRSIDDESVEAPPEKQPRPDVTVV